MQKQQMQLFSLPDRKGRKQTVLRSFYFSFSTYSNRNVNASFKMTKCRCEITIKTTTATNRKLKGKVFKNRNRYRTVPQRVPVANFNNRLHERN